MNKTIFFHSKSIPMYKKEKIIPSQMENNDRKIYTYSGVHLKVYDSVYEAKVPNSDGYSIK